MEDREIVKQNEQQYLELVRVLDPELYMIKMALQDTGVNALIIPRIIRSLGNLNIGTGYGVVEILVKSKVVTQIKNNESDVVNMTIDKNKEGNI
jgi:hypothetical protein